jgi:hypothetical protein
MNLIESMKGCSDSILGIRAKLGADLHKIYIVTRKWSGKEIGDGNLEETSEEVIPTPGIKNYSQSLRIQEGGSIKQGDLIIHQISKNKYPLESDVDCSSDDSCVDKLYKVGSDYYRVINVVQYQLTWNVQIRRLSDQTKR